MTAIAPVPAIVPLDYDSAWKSSVVTAEYCSNCRRSLHGYNGAKCPAGCRTAHPHFGWLQRNHATREDYRNKHGVRYVPVHHRLGQRRSYSKGELSAE